MATIKSGATSDLLTVDPTSKAARVTLYDANGNALSPSELARGSVSIFVRQSAATAAGATVWGLRNSSSTRTVNVLQVAFGLSFDGTGAATLMRYELIKGTGVTAFSGGVAITPAIHKTSLGQASGVDARIADTGLTVTGVTYGGAIYTATHGRLTPSATVQSAGQGQFVLDFTKLGMGPIELAQNEILSIRNGPTNASVIGDSVFGTAWFIEKNN